MYIFTNTFTKLYLIAKNWVFSLLMFFGGFFLPIQPLIIVATLAAMLDWVTKIVAVWRTQGYDSVKSNRMQDTFIKIILYAFFLGTLFVVDQLFIKTLCHDIFNLIFEQPTVNIIGKIQLASVGTLMILIREMKSIDENWEQLYGYSFLKSLTKTFSWIWQLKTKL